MVLAKKEDEYTGVRSRKSIKGNDYQYKIYGIFYTDRLDDNAIAVIAAETDSEAVSLLEEAVKGKGYMMSKTDLNAIAEETGFTTNKKGLIYGYDALSRSML